MHCMIHRRAIIGAHHPNGSMCSTAAPNNPFLFSRPRTTRPSYTSTVVSVVVMRILSFEIAFASSTIPRSILFVTSRRCLLVMGRRCERGCAVRIVSLVTPGAFFWGRRGSGVSRRGGDGVPIKEALKRVVRSMSKKRSLKTQKSLKAKKHTAHVFSRSRAAATTPNGP